MLDRLQVMVDITPFLERFHVNLVVTGEEFNQYLGSCIGISYRIRDRINLYSVASRENDGFLNLIRLAKVLEGFSKLFFGKRQSFPELNGSDMMAGPDGNDLVHSFYQKI